MAADEQPQFNQYTVYTYHNRKWLALSRLGKVRSFCVVIVCALYKHCQRRWMRDVYNMDFTRLLLLLVFCLHVMLAGVRR